MKLNYQAPSSHVERIRACPKIEAKGGRMLPAYCAVITGRESVLFGDRMYAYLTLTPWGIGLFVTQET